MVATPVLLRRANGWMPLLALRQALCMPMSAAVLTMKRNYMSATRDPKWLREMSRRLEKFFRTNTRSREWAPDLAQEALAALHSVDVTKLRNPAAYLMTIARNLAIKHSQNERWETENLQSLSDLSAANATVDLAELPQSTEPLVFTPALQRAIRKLDATSQDILTLWGNGCITREIAEAKSMTIDQVRRNLRETKALLRSLLIDESKKRK